ncbi:hypothetical protein [Candidatus Thiodictyon syntrophicum]|jgi:MATE family multidrug resistance protein|uniref:hypothetical protein n=1 Tax=Candidatus Thiodictyon syntrophicum TaxID=1166950 RepID=UPI0012FD62BF|nr:hypothetical protein [Candidatus Thiodictyon syntrophicum]
MAWVLSWGHAHHFPGLPQFGLGALGGWIGLLAYVAVLGSMMAWRWRSGAWRRIELR